MNQIIQNARSKKRIIFCVDCAAYCSHKQFSFKKYTEVDFVFLSPHKNLGGSESCGVLLGRKSIIELSKPTFPGGGTVKFVKGYKKEDIMYEDNIFSREISGTPAFLGFYRAALSF
jgi:selenocysteine lyase/cysteine desulfurase